MSTECPNPPFNLLDLVDALRDLNDEARRLHMEGMTLSPSQRAQVERCLSILPRAGRFLEDPPTLIRQAWSDTKSEVGQPLLGNINEPFGEYRLIKHLASGTFGEVWIAAHRSLDTPNAVPTCLKLLYPDRSDLDDVLREARTMASIRHENVVSVRRADLVVVDGKSIPFIEMELVGDIGDSGQFQPAKSLSTAGIVDDRPRFPFRQAAAIVADVCRGVHAAHLTGTLHRDLKPANILLEMRSRRAKVTDFGIASHSATGAAAGTASRGLGTPAYMAPEQARGQATQASDVYALGAVFYFLLCGSAPYGDASRSGPEQGRQILDELKSGRPPKPLTERVRRLPRTVAAIVSRAMDPEPARRYASAAAMSEDLDTFLARRPTVAARPGPLRRFWLWTGRNPFVAILMLVLLGGAIAGPAKHLRDIRAEQQRTEKQRQAAVAARQVAIANERVAIEQRARAEQKVAEGLVLQADAQGLAGRWLEARRLYQEAATALLKLGLPTFAADSGFFAVERNTLLPLLEWSEPNWPPLAVSFAPDGSTFCTGGGDKILRLWDPMTGRLIRELHGHTDSIQTVAFSPGGKNIASGSADGTVRLWKSDGSEPSRIIYRDEKKWVAAVAFSPDGNLLASGGYDKTVRTWDVVTGAAGTIFVLKQAVHCIRFFPDSRRLAVVADKIEILDLDSHATIRSLPTRAATLALSRDGSRLLTEGAEKGLAIWDTSDWRVVQTLKGHGGAQMSAAAFIGDDANRAVTTGWDKTVRVWDLKAEKEISTFSPHEGWVLSAALSPDNRRLITSGYDRITPMKLWDLEAVSPRIRGEARDLSADGTCALVNEAEDILHVVDLATSADLAVLPGSKETYARTVFRGGIDRALATEADGIIREWNVPEAKLVKNIRDPVRWIAGSLDGNKSLFDDKGAMVLRGDEPSRELWRRAKDVYIDWAVFSGDGNTIALWSEINPYITLFNASNGQLLKTLTSDGYRIFDVALTRDGARLVSTSGSDAPDLWDTHTGSVIRSVQAHGSGIGEVAIAPDGNWIAGSGDEPTVWLWDGATGREIRTIPTVRHPTALRVSQDGMQLLVMGLPTIYCDFRRASRDRALSIRVDAARALLAVHPDDPAALAALAEWYAFRHCDDWAVATMERARSGGAHIPALEMARAFMRLRRYSEAAREFKAALKEQSAPPAYLALCIAAAERDAQTSGH